MQLSAGRGRARGLAPRNRDRVRLASLNRLPERDDCDVPQVQERLRGAGHQPMRHEAWSRAQ
jgi:hypothetical protein